MVIRIGASAFLLIILAVPALAQDADFPRVEVAMGYANLGFPGVRGIDRHSGFAMHSGLNFVRWFGIENYTGVYSLGNDVTLLANIVGGKLVHRDALEGRIAPYLVGGIGVGYFTQEVSGFVVGGSATAARYGGGVDFQVGDSWGVKVDASRMAFHMNGWQTHWNISAGVVFRVLY